MLGQYFELTPSETSLLLDIIHSAFFCQKSFDFYQLLGQAQALIPFSYARCGFGDCSEYDNKKISAFKMVTGFPEEWEARYAREDYYLDDNIAQTAFLMPGLIHWKDYIKIPGLDDERNDKSARIMDEASSMGLEDGWLYSLRGNLSTEAAIISLAGKKFKNKERLQKILEYLAPHLGLAVKRIIQSREAGLPEKLTLRETEILSWTAAGKTAWEISQILSISQRTVAFHMGNILKKLDAVNACQAVAIGLTSGLIAY